MEKPRSREAAPVRSAVRCVSLALDVLFARPDEAGMGVLSMSLIDACISEPWHALAM